MVSVYQIVVVIQTTQLLDTYQIRKEYRNVYFKEKLLKYSNTENPDMYFNICNPLSI